MSHSTSNIAQSLGDVASQVSGVQDMQKKLMRSLENLTPTSPTTNESAVTTLPHQNQQTAVPNYNSLKAELDDLSSRISQIMAKLADIYRMADEQEQYSRRNCVVLHGYRSVPETDYDKFETHMLETLNNCLNLDKPLTPHDVDTSHKLRSKNNEKPPIIIKFVRRSVKAKVYAAKRRLKGSGLTITESLTKRRLDLLNVAKDAFGFKRVWTYEGRIYTFHQNKRQEIRTFIDVDNLKSQRSYSAVTTGSGNKKH